jgi:microcystin-dependent protein
MLLTQMPAHTHTTTVSVGVAGSNADNESPVGNVFAVPSSDSFGTVANASAAGTSLILNPAGGNQPFSIMQPYLAVNYVICMFGVYPARN